MAAKLYVGGLSYSTTSDGLREFFAQSGNVLSATVITDRFSGHARGLLAASVGAETHFSVSCVCAVFTVARSTTSPSDTMPWSSHASLTTGTRRIWFSRISSVAFSTESFGEQDTTFVVMHCSTLV